MNEQEKQAWETILSVADRLPAEAAAYLQGYAQAMADSNGRKSA